MYKNFPLTWGRFKQFSSEISEGLYCGPVSVISRVWGDWYLWCPNANYSDRHRSCQIITCSILNLVLAVSAKTPWLWTVPYRVWEPYLRLHGSCTWWRKLGEFPSTANIARRRAKVLSRIPQKIYLPAGLQCADMIFKKIVVSLRKLNHYRGVPVIPFSQVPWNLMKRIVLYNSLLEKTIVRQVLCQQLAEKNSASFHNWKSLISMSNSKDMTLSFWRLKKGWDFNDPEKRRKYYIILAKHYSIL